MFDCGVVGVLVCCVVWWVAVVCCVVWCLGVWCGGSACCLASNGRSNH